MSESERKRTCLKFIRSFKKDKVVEEFDTKVSVLQEEASEEGLDDDVLDKLADIIIHTELGAVKRVALIKCLIPKYKLPEKIARTIITWCLSSMNKIPHTVCLTIIQWIIGLWDYELVDRKVINIYYDVFFHKMLKKKQLEPYFARLIYVLTKPEDVSRREVSQLLVLKKNSSKPPKHITALLSLFKSYKPELVPERIQSVNVESVWKSINEFIRLALEGARDRAEIQQSEENTQVCFNWNAVQDTKMTKKEKNLLPSISYFHIGSNIFKDKDAKSIFEINGVKELGKYHQNIELPCNAVSLLVNTAGYHLLTYANFQYQSRFSCNLYNTLIRAFILENGKFSKEQINKFLTMTIEFSRYMQEGILVMKLFLHEYLYYNTGEHLSKLLNLLQWMNIISIDELQNILIYVQNIFYESNLYMKCEIIKSLWKLITNLYIRQGLEESCQETSPFLGQRPLDNLAEIVFEITKVAENLIVSGLNTHNYNIILLSDSLEFYEEICTLEHRSYVPSWTLPPSAVVYGAFVARNCVILSRICGLLLRYREMSPHLRQIVSSDIYQKKIHIISIYARDIYTALWLDEPFRCREDNNFLRNLSQDVIDDLSDCDLDISLNIYNHYAVLCYRHKMIKMGLNIDTKEDAKFMAAYYYPAINKFISAFDK
ncbi:centromere protein I-like [Linepithema humile]|uniref:centromere protein I-like n=1 Tax=Linepithema humile TaxID=83485 RepID=UPI0006238A44|nr:PREDICTED: centromere protein I-like [Linepithema humile]XP_012235721.1 PREDICTED: centromere protein I-like [Linepithema humile]XP_012235722.1 PREDICTED: centromere protein I-like [Linepithema humile]